MEKLRLRARPAEAAPGEAERTRSPGREAVANALSVLPWRDPGKSAPRRLVLYLAVLPAVFMLVASLVALLAELPSSAAFSVSFLLHAFGCVAASCATAFVGSLALPALVGGARSRVREALVCPYCRDSVDRGGTVICARKKCGALYHRECWEECRSQYGGCAVYGCSSRGCREVSAAGYALRVARLLLAAALFPPRAVRALRKVETESGISVYWSAVQASRRVYSWTNRDGGRQAIFVLALGIPLSYAAAIPFIQAINASRSSAWPGLGLIATIFLGPFAMLVIPYILAIPILFVVTFLRAIKRALESEFSALERADQGGTTVLGRLAAGVGKKA
jgi:hypothetical protein